MRTQVYQADPWLLANDKVGLNPEAVAVVIYESAVSAFSEEEDPWRLNQRRSSPARRDWLEASVEYEGEGRLKSTDPAVVVEGPAVVCVNLPLRANNHYRCEKSPSARAALLHQGVGAGRQYLLVWPQLIFGYR
jgi:hypothetical protein